MNENTSVEITRQIRPAPAITLRAVWHPLIGWAHPRHRGALRTQLLSPRALRTLRSTRKIIAGGRHRGVTAVARLLLQSRTLSSSATLVSRNRSTRTISSARDSSSNPDTAQDHHSWKHDRHPDTPKINYGPQCLPSNRTRPRGLLDGRKSCPSRVRRRR
jgi:hypothetical protein